MLRVYPAVALLTFLVHVRGLPPHLHDRIHLELGLMQLRLGQEASAREHFAQALRVTHDRARLEARIAGLSTVH